jgi:DNA-binding transcriptional ArsR family regulator
MKDVKQTKELSSEALEQVALRFKLLSDPMRLKILHSLQNGEKTVTELVKMTGSSQPNISKHLNILKTTGMVKRRQESNQAFFSIAAPFIFDLCNIVCNGISQELEQLQRSLD